ncbi:RING finger protein 223 [Labeo rohita]|uniref:RING finger protein 223 n=2 Tax=Labeo rohita TaxID=84645 RepID=A0ABQ8LIT8_LABRO|nr:RING finger protein 223 [Labeo rohita]
MRRVYGGSEENRSIEPDGQLKATVNLVKGHQMMTMIHLLAQACSVYHFLNPHEEERGRPYSFEMEPSPVVWHTQVVPLEIDLERANSQPECSICFTTYDNVFKTPKQLDCTHTFCLECLSRIMATSMDPQNSKISCPFCRHPTTVPKKGPPALTTSQEVLCRLPVHQQHEEPVWLDGDRLCYKQPIDIPGVPAFCICVDIGASGRNAVSATQTQPRLGLLDRLMDCKRLLLFIFLSVLLMGIIMWPLQCIVTTGSMRCASQNLQMPTTTPSTTTVNL